MFKDIDQEIKNFLKAAQGKIAIPTMLSTLDKMIWKTGRDTAIKDAETQFYKNQPLQPILSAPKNVEKSDIWLNGYNITVHFLQQGTQNIINQAIKNMAK